MSKSKGKGKQDFVFPDVYDPNKWMSASMKMVSSSSTQAIAGVSSTEAIAGVVEQLDEDMDLDVRCALSQSTANQRGWGTCFAAATATEMVKYITTTLFGKQTHINWALDFFANAQPPGPHEQFYDFDELFDSRQFFKVGLFQKIIQEIDDPLNQSKVLIWITIIKYLCGLRGWDIGGGGIMGMHIEMNNFLVELKKLGRQDKLTQYFHDLFSCQIIQQQSTAGRAAFGALPDIDIGGWGRACVSKVVELFFIFLARVNIVERNVFETLNISITAGEIHILYSTQKKATYALTHESLSQILKGITKYTSNGFYVPIKVTESSSSHLMVIGAVDSTKTLYIKNSWGPESTGNVFGFYEMHGIIQTTLKDVIETCMFEIGFRKFHLSKNFDLLVPTLLVPPMVVPPMVQYDESLGGKAGSIPKSKKKTRKLGKRRRNRRTSKKGRGN